MKKSIGHFLYIIPFILSLIENLKRRGLNNKAKKVGLIEIYRAAGFKDLDKVGQHLTSLRDRRYLMKKYRLNKSIPHEGLKYTKVNVPESFIKLADRIGYSYSRQSSIIQGFGDFEEDRDWTKEINPMVRTELDNPLFESRPIIKQETARRDIIIKRMREVKEAIFKTG